MNDYCAARFKNEKLAAHWQVDETAESYSRLLWHLEVRSNFKPYFEEAIKNLNLDDSSFRDSLIVADIGAGVCWTSAILAKHPKVKLVYAVDPSDNRLKHAKFVIRHFGVEDKVKITYGTFLEPNIPQKVDLVVLCGSLHHCNDEHILGLFSNIRQLLKPAGKVLIANEHYVNWVWSLKRLVGCIYHFGDQSKLYYSFRKPRAPHPFGGEHWRTRKELETIFKENDFSAKFSIYNGDLCKDKHSLYHRLGWFYYYAILELK